MRPRNRFDTMRSAGDAVRHRARFGSFTAAVALGAALAAATAHAVTFLDTGFGTPPGGSSARSLAMGSAGTTLHYGSDALVLNPAVLLPDQGQVELDITGGLTHASEDRLVPLFDSFQSFVDETIVALNRNSYGSGQGGVVWRLPIEQPMALGIGIFDRFDFDYDYFEEFRDPRTQSDPRDKILQQREISVDGRLRSLSLGYAAEIDKRVRIGLSGHRYFADVERDVTVLNFQTSSSIGTTTSQSLAGWGFTVGGWGRVNERVDLGVAFEGPFRVDGDFENAVRQTSPTTDSTVSSTTPRAVDYPSALRFGLAYHPRNTLRTTFALEMERRFWETLDTPVQSVLGDTLEVRDTWDFRLGLEHVFYNDLPVRFGFRYLQSYADPESERSIYSVGFGYHVAGFALDVTGLYHRQTSRQPFLFDPSYLQFQAPGSDERVEDSLVQVVFGAARRF